MRKTNLRKSRGITLIALVITIIVLLILAGVAISMLSGENGILRKATEAKTKTEEAQKEEETALLSMELETHFQTTNSKYKCSNGLITGIDASISDTVIDPVSDLENALPDGYTIQKKIVYDTNTKELKEEKLENKENTNVSTGMIVEKDGRTIATTIVYGDLNGNGEIDMSDVLLIQNYRSSIYKINGFIKVAMDVNFDGKINSQDLKIIQDCYLEQATQNQNKYASNPNNIIGETQDYIKEQYMQKLKQKLEETSYTMTFNSGGIGLIKGPISEQMTVEGLLNILPDKENIKLTDKSTTNEVTQDKERVLEIGDHIIYVYDGMEIQIAVVIGG